MRVRDRDYLRTTLAHTGLTYRQLAEKAGVNHATLANLARPGGRQSCSEGTARAICAAVGVDVGLLFLSSVCGTDVQDDTEITTARGESA